MADKKVTKTKTTKTTKVSTAKKKVAVKKQVAVDEKFAVISISGTQIKVYEGKEYEVKKLEGKKGDKLEIREVLLLSDGKDVKIGKPYVKDASVKLEISSQKKGPKVEGFTYSAKSRHRRNYGFRESITKVIVKSL